MVTVACASAYAYCTAVYSGYWCSVPDYGAPVTGDWGPEGVGYVSDAVYGMVDYARRYPELELALWP